MFSEPDGNEKCGKWYPGTFESEVLTSDTEASDQAAPYCAPMPTIGYVYSFDQLSVRRLIRTRSNGLNDSGLYLESMGTSIFPTPWLSFECHSH